MSQPAVLLAAAWLSGLGRGRAGEGEGGRGVGGRVSEQETVDKERDVKNLEVKFFSPPLNMKALTSCGGMPLFKWASSICGCVMV